MIDSIKINLPPSHPWMKQIHYYDVLDSTNALAKEMAQHGMPHGTVILADRQTAGRGRMGRSFHSPAGQGIYMSVLLRPQCPASQLMHLTCAAAVAVCNAIKIAAGFSPSIKWTNDLVWEKKKLGGILSELVLDKDGTAQCAILGIGINCGQTLQDFPEELQDMATSVLSVTGKTPDRGKLAAAMIASLADMAESLLSCKTEYMNAYRRNCMTLGQPIRIVDGDRVRYATAIDVDENGKLLVQFADGRQEMVGSGEVSVRGMYGYAK